MMSIKKKLKVTKVSRYLMGHDLMEEEEPCPLKKHFRKS
jgi:hypothetical protein